MFIRLLRASRNRRGFVTASKYQSGGEFNSSSGSWSKELVAYRKFAGGTEDPGYPFGHGKLSSIKNLRPQLSGGDPSRPSQSSDQAPSLTYSFDLGQLCSRERFSRITHFSVAKLRIVDFFSPLITRAIS